jgi:hypothetical protein
MVLVAIVTIFTQYIVQTPRSIDAMSIFQFLGICLIGFIFGVGIAFYYNVISQNLEK